MKLQISAADLKAALKTISPAINNRSVIPVLGSVYVSVRKDEVVFMGSTMDLTIIHTIKKENDNKFDFLIDYQFIKNISSTIADPIEFALKDKSITITSSTTKFKTPIGGELNEFPKAPSDKGAKALTFNPAICKSILNASDCVNPPTVVNDFSEFILADILDGELNVIASDKHIMFREKFDFTGETSKLMISPEIAKLISTSPDPLEILYTEKNIFYTTQNTTYISITTHSKWTDWRPFFGKEKLDVCFSAWDAIRVFNSASMVSTTTFAPIAELSLKGEIASVEVSNLDFNYEAKGEFVFSHLEPTDFELKVNCQKIVKALSRFTNAEIENVKATYLPNSNRIVLGADESNIQLICQTVTT